MVYDFDKSEKGLRRYTTRHDCLLESLFVCNDYSNSVDLSGNICHMPPKLEK